jgi:predicted lipoprotein with Yx(FWY)xxD motif
MRPRTPIRLVPAGAVIAALSLAIVAAGCGSSNDNSSTSAGGGGGGGGIYGGGSSKSAAPSGGGGAAVISVADNAKLGKILVDSKGNTVYYFEKDKQGSNLSTCSGACAAAWPPVTSTGTPTGQKGAEASKLGSFKRSDGSTQVSYNGWPLYTYAGDSKPGDANGNNLEQFGAEWYALTTAGTKPPGT